MARRAIPLLAAALAGLPVGLASAPTASAATCRNLTASTAVKADLRAAHRRVTSRPFTGPRAGSTYYGRCGRIYYALASFRDRQLGYQDQPERFVRRAGGRWRDRGDTGGDVCDAAPRALLRIWRLCRR